MNKNSKDNKLIFTATEEVRIDYEYEVAESDWERFKERLGGSSDPWSKQVYPQIKELDFVALCGEIEKYRDGKDCLMINIHESWGDHITSLYEIFVDEIRSDALDPIYEVNRDSTDWGYEESMVLRTVIYRVVYDDYNSNMDYDDENEAINDAIENFHLAPTIYKIYIEDGEEVDSDELYNRYEIDDMRKDY